ncbi:GNAT family N-acetyltransferase [uncultured Roseobacter sp.]|uniref:GNAT family N-acetyltransferase n=1 Tax=uncultured Roseobacter sp. TaxID=114847 RepID=UPI002612FE9C|nr:GNAT family N-acetyltransferase [uncultured Roseobacter sp.]
MIRVAVVEDAPLIAALWNAMIRETTSTFTTIEKTQEEVASLITQRPGAFFVAGDGPEPVGFATYGPFRPGPGYTATVEHTIILSADAQGTGLGRALMARLEEAARADSIHVMIAAISNTNQDAQAFHGRLGFLEVARMPQVGRKSGQWLDLVLMQKIL